MMQFSIVFLYSAASAVGGAHRFVIDLLISDGSTIDRDYGPAETWDPFRSGIWNCTASPVYEAITLALA